jgi:RNA polymerase sigma factor (sigma-70 family)
VTTLVTSDSRLDPWCEAVARVTRFTGMICGRSSLPLTNRGMDSDSASSAELLVRVRDGDRDALETLLHRYVPALRRWARGRLPRWARDAAETEDIVQDTVMRTFQRLETFEYRHDGALQAYLRQAVLNRITDECRRRARRPQPTELDQHTRDQGVSPLEAAIGVQATERYEAALAMLRADQREAVVARVEMGFSYQEIAVMLGKPSPDAARVAVSRALVRLAESMRNGR